MVLLQGAAELLIEGEPAPRSLRPGDYVELPAHVRHRVERTLAGRPTVWLAIHWKGTGPPSLGSGLLEQDDFKPIRPPI